MDPITIGLLLGAATGAVKGASDSDKEKRQRVEAAAAQRWSPWTGIKANAIQTADMPGSVMQGGLTGAMIGQGMGKGSPAATNADPIYSDAKGAALNGTGPITAAQNPAPPPVQAPADYSTPDGAGYASYPGAGAGAAPQNIAQQRPPYNGPKRPRPPSAWAGLNY